AGVEQEDHAWLIDRTRAARQAEQLARGPQRPPEAGADVGAAPPAGGHPPAAPARGEASREAGEQALHPHELARGPFLIEGLAAQEGLGTVAGPLAPRRSALLGRHPPPVGRARRKRARRSARSFMPTPRARAPRARRPRRR